MTRSIPWPRILAEGFAIVVSILLAFGIQAWWEAQAEDRVRLATVSGLISDFEANQGSVTRFLGFNTRIEHGHDLLLELLDGASPSTEVEVPDSLLVAAVNAPIISPSRAALDAAVATGRLDLIRSDALREHLARWLRQVELTLGHETVVRQIVADHVVPLLARQTSLNEVHMKVRPWNTREYGDGFATTIHTLRGDSELVGVLAHRRFRSGFVVLVQTGLLDLQEAILAGLREELTL